VSSFSIFKNTATNKKKLTEFLNKTATGTVPLTKKPFAIPIFMGQE
jgi:hypothetical protein